MGTRVGSRNGDLQVLEGELDTQGRKILARHLRNSGT